MKKLLASDYDGTLLLQGEIFSRDLEAISNFRNNGNLFGIITGRSISMIVDDLENHQIPLDFLVCNNGGIICDYQLNIVRRHDIPIELAIELIQSIRAKWKVMLGISDGDAFGSVTSIIIPASKTFIPPKNMKKIPYEEILANKKVNSIIIRGKTHVETLGIKDHLEQVYGNQISLHFNNGTLDINSNIVSKKNAVYELGEYFQTSKLHVIGDGYNDLEMIREFKGFALENAVDIVKTHAGSVVPSVSVGINMIEME